MMTVTKVKQLVCQQKRVSLRQVYRYIGDLGLLPTTRQRPQQYPADTADRILNHLGFSSAADRTPTAATKRESKPVVHLPAGKLISVRTLRAARPKKQTNKK